MLIHLKYGVMIIRNLGFCSIFLIVRSHAVFSRHVRYSVSETMFNNEIDQIWRHKVLHALYVGIIRLHHPLL